MWRWRCEERAARREPPSAVRRPLTAVAFLATEVGAAASHLSLYFGKWLLLRRSHARPHSPGAVRQIAPPSRGAPAPHKVAQPLPSRVQPVDAHTSPHAKEFFLRPPSKLYASTVVATLLGALHAVVNFARLAARALELEVVALRSGLPPADPVARLVRDARIKDFWPPMCAERCSHLCYRQSTSWQRHQSTRYAT